VSPNFHHLHSLRKNSSWIYHPDEPGTSVIQAISTPAFSSLLTLDQFVVLYTILSRRLIMSTYVPKVQRAAIIKEFGQDLVLETEHPVKQPSELAPGECLIKMEYAGVCHSDIHAKQGDWGRRPTLPLVGGHEVRSGCSRGECTGIILIVCIL
jgi:hypothetical protein